MVKHEDADLSLFWSPSYILIQHFWGPKLTTVTSPKREESFLISPLGPRWETEKPLCRAGGGGSSWAEPCSCPEGPSLRGSGCLPVRGHTPLSLNQSVTSLVSESKPPAPWEAGGTAGDCATQPCPLTSCCWHRSEEHTMQLFFLSILGSPERCLRTLVCLPQPGPGAEGEQHGGGGQGGSASNRMTWKAPIARVA